MTGKTLGIAAVLAASLLGTVAGAAEDAAPPAPPGSLLDAVDRSHDAISRQLDAFARRIDWFLGGARVCEDTEGSSLRASGIVVVPDDGRPRFDQTLRARLVLPNTRDRFRILLESDPERDLEEPLSPGARTTTENASLTDQAEVSRLAAALELVLREREKWLASADGGVRLKYPPDPFARVRLKRTVPLGSWRLRGSETLFVFESIGAGASTRLDLETLTPGCKLFLSSSEAVWKERRRAFELSQNLFLFHELGPSQILTYRIGATGDTEPNTQLTDWGLGVEYRRSIHKDWVFFAVQPALTFAKEDDFDAVASVRFRLDLVFGGEGLSSR